MYILRSLQRFLLRVQSRHPFGANALRKPLPLSMMRSRAQPIQGTLNLRHTPHAILLTVNTRFLVVVLSAYKQIRAQEMPILHDVNEADFDRAFELIRPRTSPFPCPFTLLN